MSKNEEKISSSVVFISEKNEPIFCDSIEVDSNFVSSPQLPTISSFFTTKVIHYFRCNCGTYDEYLYTHVHYGKTYKKINLLKDNFILSYSKQSQKYLECLKMHLFQQIESDNILFSTIIPAYIKYGKKNIATYFVCGVDISAKTKRKHISKTPIQKKQLEQPLFKTTKLFDLLNKDLTDDEIKMTRNNTYQLMQMLKDKVVFNNNIETTQKIIRPTHYVNNVDTISLANNNYDCNTLYLFCSITKFKQQINDLIISYNQQLQSRTETFEKIYNLVINYAIALFYVNISHGNCKEEDFNVYNIFFLELFLINSWLFNKQHFTMDGGNIETLYRKTCKKFDRLFVLGLHNHLNNILGIVSAGSCNKCLFPDYFTKEEKEQWKSENGIERKKENKKRKSKISPQKRNKIIKLHNDGYSIRQIENELSINKNTINKILKNSL